MKKVKEIKSCDNCDSGYQSNGMSCVYFKHGYTCWHKNKEKLITPQPKEIEVYYCPCNKTYCETKCDIKKSILFNCTRLDSEIKDCNKVFILKERGV